MFSERKQKGFDAEGWDTVLATYQNLFKKEFGDYKLEDFTFEFNGFEGHQDRQDVEGLSRGRLGVGGGE